MFPPDEIQKRKKFVYSQQDGNALFKENDFFIDLTIYGVPASLLKEFCEKIVKPHYPDGTSQAIRELMRKTIERETSKKVLESLSQISLN